MVKPSASFDLDVPSQGVEVQPDVVSAPSGVAVLAVLVAATCWSFTGIAYRLILDEFDVSPLGVVAIRASISAIVLLGVVLARQELRSQLLLPRSRNLALPLIGAGLVSGTGFYIALIYTFEVAGVAVGTVLLYFAPSLVAFDSWMLFKDRISRVQKIALMTSLVGVVGVSGVITGGETFRPAGIALGLASAICYASYSLFGQHLLTRLHPLVVVCLSGVIGSLGMWLIKLAVEGAVMPSLTALAWIVAVTGVGTTLIPLVLYT